MGQDQVGAGASLVAEHGRPASRIATARSSSRATGYDTTLVGEAEIGAWELASGCRHYYAAWMLNLGAALTGLFLAPRRVVRAFHLGRHCTNLYHIGVDADWPEETVRGLRQRLGLHTDCGDPSRC